MNAIQEMTEPLFSVGERVRLLGTHPVEGRVRERHWGGTLFRWRYLVETEDGQKIGVSEDMLALVETPERWQRDPLRSFGSVVHCDTGRALQRARKPSRGVAR